MKESKENIKMKNIHLLVSIVLIFLSPIIIPFLQVLFLPILLIWIGAVLLGKFGFFQFLAQIFVFAGFFKLLIGLINILSIFISEDKAIAVVFVIFPMIFCFIILYISVCCSCDSRTNRTE